MDEAQISLREKKYAKTKLALLQEFISKMKDSRFEDISIKEICEKVEVSEGTFFNYFHQKVEVLIYYKTLTVTKMNWYLNTQRNDLSPLQKIDVAFDLIADELKEPNFFYEMVRTMISEKVRDEVADISPVEKHYAFPDCPGVEAIESIDLCKFFEHLVNDAFAAGEISEEADRQTVYTALMSLLIGLPLAIEIEDFPRLKEIFKSQLSILGKGLERKGGKQ